MLKPPPVFGGLCIRQCSHRGSNLSQRMFGCCLDGNRNLFCKGPGDSIFSWMRIDLLNHFSTWFLYSSCLWSYLATPATPVIPHYWLSWSKYKISPTYLTYAQKTILFYDFCICDYCLCLQSCTIWSILQFWTTWGSLGQSKSPPRILICTFKHTIFFYAQQKLPGEISRPFQNSQLEKSYKN